MKKKALVLLTLAVALVGLVCLSCAQGINPMLRMAQTGANFVSKSDPVLRHYYEIELSNCLTRPEEQRDSCIVAVRKDWEPVKVSLKEMRAAWCEFEPSKCEAQDAAHSSGK